MRLVVRTCLVGQPLALHLLVDRGLVSAVAAVLVCDAGDDDLRRDLDRGELRIAHDLDAVRQHGGRCECPARAAVGRDVLVAHCGREVYAVHVSPVVG